MNESSKDILKEASEQMEKALDWADWFYTKGVRPFSRSAKGWPTDRADIATGLVKLNILITELEGCEKVGKWPEGGFF
jgi:hypothetical protein